MTCRTRVPPPMIHTAPARDAWQAACRPLKQLAVALLVLVVAYLACGVLQKNSHDAPINAIGPIFLLLGCLRTAWSICKAEPMACWTPVPWFLAASAAYFGLGPLIYTFGQDEAVRHLDRVPLLADDLWRTNLLNAVGLLVISSVFLIGLGLTKPTRNRLRLGATGAAPHQAEAKAATLVFLAIGLPVKYLVALPYEFGLLDVMLPGSVYSLESFATLAVLTTAYLSRTSTAWRTAFFCLFTLEVAVGLARFSKQAFLVVLILAALGRFLASRRRGELCLSIVVVSVTYIVLTPMVTWSRIELIDRVGNFYEAPLSLRFQVAGEAVQALRNGTLSEGQIAQAWWQRLCYANIQALVMRRHDAGHASDSLSLAVYSFIPRALWPGKPNMTRIGVEVTQLAYGHRGGSTGIGVFAEAYWNVGWAGVVGVSIYIGLLFAMLSRFALRTMQRGQWLYLPCIFIGIKMGFRLDGWFAADFVGTVFICVTYAGAISVWLSHRGPARGRATAVRRGGSPAGYRPAPVERPQPMRTTP